MNLIYWTSFVSAELQRMNFEQLEQSFHQLLQKSLEGLLWLLKVFAQLTVYQAMQGILLAFVLIILIWLVSYVLIFILQRTLEIAKILIRVVGALTVIMFIIFVIYGALDTQRTCLDFPFEQFTYCRPR